MTQNPSAKSGSAPNWEKFVVEKSGGITLWDAQTQSRARGAYAFGAILTGKSRVWESYQITIDTLHGQFSGRDSGSCRTALRQLQKAVHARFPNLFLLVAGLAEGFSESGMSYNSGYGYIGGRTEHMMHEVDPVEVLDAAPSLPPSRVARIRGGILGALVGDALGVPVEFQSRFARHDDPVTDMRGFGTHNQPPGTWSDDGALLLCTAEAIIEGLDSERAGKLYLRWWREGHWAARGEVFDIGGATKAALLRLETGIPADEAGGAGESENGNGSLMRILPVALRFSAEPPEVIARAAMQISAVTHRHPRSQLACTLYCHVVKELLHANAPVEAWRNAVALFQPLLAEHPTEAAIFSRVCDARFADLTEAQIRSSGYVIDTLEAALWCLLQGGSFADIVRRAVNLGDDTDTTGCVAAGLAGIWLGAASIPAGWLSALGARPELTDLIEDFMAACQAGE
jgi:ADP-ribosylglycohydrolase